ncbi:hypothetical protein K503DRAFT_767468 [Rhizopogon vinicolor AM-OR11-026]|uniref:DUF6534 domain-containing protein n=1 Tax=Rhizopogon vinicolor AM-OR11-026 TaxID=1314800 RepID=A0A1B7N9Y1_9AGAM|nr:hypothetical protein K503DRAFT_767468 [Rhizopogon vinicolor AM-OR11-026]
MVEEREVVLHFDNTLGALLIGFAVSATAFGMLTIQVYTYYRRFPQDKVAYKVLAALIWLLSLVDQVFIGNGVYFYNITNFLNPLALIATRPQWSLILQMTLGAVVGAIVKGCFTLRVWRFSYKNWWLTGFLFFFIFAQLATAIVFTVKCFQLPTTLALSSLRFVGSLSLGLGVVTDMCIAAALFIYLQKMHSSYANTESLINKLTIYAVNTGLLTSTFSASTLILFNLMPTNFVFICFYFVLSKLYAISFLATLNTRKIIRGRGTDREGGKTSSFQMVTESMRRSVQIPIQAPMPTIRDDDWPARSDSLRKNYDTPGYDSNLSTTRLTTHCVTV